MEGFSPAREATSASSVADPGPPAVPTPKRSGHVRTRGSAGAAVTGLTGFFAAASTAGPAGVWAEGPAWAAGTATSPRATAAAAAVREQRTRDGARAGMWEAFRGSGRSADGERAGGSRTEREELATAN